MMRLCSKIVVFLMLLTISQWAFADVMIKPTYVKLDLSERRPSGTLKVTNTTQERKRYRITTHHFNLINNSLKIIEPNQRSLSNWIKFSPREFTLNPGSSRQIRYTIIKPKIELDDGMYWGALAFAPLEGRKAIYTADDDSTVEYEVIPRMFIPIYGELGKQQRLLSLEIPEQAKRYSTSSNTYLLGKVKNVGNSRVKLKALFVLRDPGSGKQVYSGNLPILPLFPESAMQLAIALPEDIPSGQYQLTIEVDGEQTEKISKKMILNHR